MSHRLLLVDLSGTLMHHETKRPVALMPELLTSANNEGWSVFVVSRYPAEAIQSSLDQLGLSDMAVPVSSAGSNKGKVMAEIVGRHDAEVAVFIDDKPDNLKSAAEIGNRRLRVIGFIGSRKYTPALSDWCINNSVELALSALDLAETLRIPLSIDTDVDRWLDKYTPDEIADLLLGSDHPASAKTAETVVADHRAAPYLVLESEDRVNYQLFWQNLAWVSCRECTWKLLVRSVLQSMGLEEKSTLGSPYYDHEYVSAVAKFSREHPEATVLPKLREAIEVVEKGVKAIGVKAAECRPDGRWFNRDRVEDLNQYLARVEAEQGEDNR